MFVDPIWEEVQSLKYRERLQKRLKSTDADRRLATSSERTKLSAWSSKLGDSFIAIGLRLKAERELDSAPNIVTNLQQSAQR